MGLIFRKSFKLFPKLKINVGKKNTSISFGNKGFSVNAGTRGVFINSALPSTGLSSRSKLFTTKHRRNKRATNQQNIDSGVTLGVIAGALIFLVSGSFMHSFIPVIAFPFISALHKDTSEETLKSKKTNDEYIRPLKRREHVQQLINTVILSQGTSTQEKQQTPTDAEEEKLLPLLEVDHI